MATALDSVGLAYDRCSVDITVTQTRASGIPRLKILGRFVHVS